MSKKSIIFAGDGSVYKNHPFYKDYLTDLTNKIFIQYQKSKKPEVNINEMDIKFVTTSDGSGRGAAIIAIE